MILKGSQRAGGSDLASHLQNELDNESIEIAEIRGVAADDLHGAFAEFEALAKCFTKAKEPLYSLSINPPQPISREQYAAAIDRIEERLGLTDQPRTVVFHVKEDDFGKPREHCHVVWSRTDVEAGRAVHLSYDKEKLCSLSIELGRAFGLPLAPGHETLARQQEAKWAKKGNLELYEKAQQEVTGVMKADRAALVSEIYERSDGGEAFRSALEENSYVLAQGDKRGFVIVDHYGEVHSLSRQLKGVTAKTLRQKLAPFAPKDLPTVEQAREQAAQRDQAARERERELVKKHSAEAFAKLTEQQQTRRRPVEAEKQTLETRHWHERFELSQAHQREGGSFWAGFSKKAFELLDRVPALRSVIGHLRGNAMLNPERRQELENEALEKRHARERKMHDRKLVSLGKVEAYERRSLLNKLTRIARETERQGDDRAPEHETDHTQDQVQEAEQQAQSKERKSWAERERELEQRYRDLMNRPGGLDRTR